MLRLFYLKLDAILSLTVKKTFNCKLSGDELKMWTKKPKIKNDKRFASVPPWVELCKGPCFTALRPFLVWRNVSDILVKFPIVWECDHCHVVFHSFLLRIVADPLHALPTCLIVNRTQLWTRVFLKRFPCVTTYIFLRWTFPCARAVIIYCVFLLHIINRLEKGEFFLFFVNVKN